MSATTKRALVTGASGFIGSHLVRHLRQSGCQVGVLARPGAIQKLTSDPNIDLVFRYDGPTTDVVAAVGEMHPDIVFHLASLVLSQHTPEQIPDLIQSNILFGTQLLEAMRLGHVSRIVSTGTSWQHFSGASFNPVNLYASTKQAFDDILRYYTEVSGFRAISLKLFDSYGPGDTRRKVLRQLIEAVKTGQVMELSPGAQILDLVHVNDICRAFLHAAHLVEMQQQPGLADYGVSGSQHRTLREVAGIVEGAAGKPLHAVWGARDYREREVMVPWDGPRLPGWEPNISLAEGVRAILDDEMRQSNDPKPAEPKPV